MRPKALLIGVPFYEDPNIKSLPFIESDLEDLKLAFEGDGYDVELHPTGKTSGDYIRLALHSFLKGAAPKQDLVIVFSGHGLHNGGVDYLLPSTAVLANPDFATFGVNVNVDALVEDYACGDVVVIVDACREGVNAQHMATAGAIGWSRVKSEAVAGRTVSYLYACGPGQFAHYVETPETSFSLFSRALATVARNRDVPGDLAAARDAVQVEIDDLRRKYGRSQQQQVALRISAGERPPPALFWSRNGPGPLQSDDPWVRAASDHQAWNLLSRPDQVREETIRLVWSVKAIWDRARETLANDPWWDESIAQRTVDRTESLLEGVFATANPPTADDVSEAEVAVLVGFPFVHAAFVVATLAQAWPLVDPAKLADAERDGDGTDEQKAFARFLAARPFLRRRLKQLVTQEADTPDTGDTASWEIVSWLLRRHVFGLPESFRESHVRQMLGLADAAENASRERRLIADAFAAERVSRLLRAHRTDLVTVIKSERGQDSSGDELLRDRANVTKGRAKDKIRERLVGLLLHFAHRCAPDAGSLSTIIVEHLGIADAVEPRSLLTTLQGADWERDGEEGSLRAECSHQAVDLAMHEHLECLSTDLRRMRDLIGGSRTLEPLGALPSYVSGKGISAAELEDGRRAYDGQGFRFRLDERVRELLMGVQLYRDPGLAIRELYQNALDACRYRKARLEYLRITGRPVPPWEGRILFRHGQENGRPYLDCVDEGIGMRDVELAGVFSNAGARFYDLPEFVEEYAKWRDVGVEFYPTSRFGIGVLSYFMLADEITVTTARLDKQGRPTRKLKVVIAGPGSLSRVQDLGAATDAGTRVRLYLTKEGLKVSAPALLRSVLWLCEFKLRAENGDDTLLLKPERLSAEAPLGPMDEMLGAALQPAIVTKATGSAKVWWCEGTGAVLADGIWAGERLFGAVVNLDGKDAPTLTIDRREMTQFSRATVDAALEDQIPHLLNGGLGAGTHPWLGRLAVHNPSLADRIAEAAVATVGAGWPLTDAAANVRLADLGVFPYDVVLLNRRSRAGGTRYAASELPEQLLAWRLIAWVAAGLLPGVTVTDRAGALLARPSDLALLSADADWSAVNVLAVGEPVSSSGTAEERVRWLPEDRSVPRGHVLAVAALVGRSTADLAERLRKLGWAVEAGDWPQNVDTEDRIILSCSLDGRGPWLSAEAAIPVGHVISGAAAMKLPVTEVVERLERYGFRTPHVEWSLLDDEGKRLISVGLDGAAPWLPPDHAVPDGHVLAASSMLRLTPSDCARRLQSLGYAIPRHDWPERVDDLDLRLLSLNGDGHAPWRDGERVDRAEQLVLAVRVDVAPAVVAERLSRCGLAVAAHGSGLPAPSDPDWRRLQILLSRDGDATAPWIDPSAEVEVTQVLKMAQALAEGSWGPAKPSAVMESLMDWGFYLAPGPWDDVDDPGLPLLLSRDGDGKAPGLSRTGRTPPGHVFAAATRTGRTPADVARILRTWGFDVGEGQYPEQVDHVGTCVLSERLDGSPPWVSGDQPVRAAHILAAAHAGGCSARELARAVERLGVPVQPHAWPERLDVLDDRTARLPLPDSSVVDLGELLVTSARTELSPPDLLRAWQSLGFIPPPGVIPENVDEVLLRCLSRDGDGRPPWLASDVRVSAAQVLVAADTTGWEPRRVVSELTAIGHDPEGLEWAAASTQDLVALSRDLDGQAPWLGTGQAVQAGHVLAVAGSTGRGPREVASLLERYGYEVRGHEWPDRVDHSDLVLLSRGLDGRWPWLESSEVVTARHVLGAAEITGRGPAQIARSLVGYGFSLPGPLIVAPSASEGS